MPFLPKTMPVWGLTLFGLFFLVSCATGPPADTHAKANGVSAPPGWKQEISLSLEEALSHALAHNLDARVNALEALAAQNRISLEQLSALPSVELSGGVRGRSNNGASSSRSILTQQESVEPSTSTDRERGFYELQTRLSMIDTALALLQAQSAEDQAEIQKLRLRKVRNTIQRDVYSAYARAVYAQNIEKELGFFEEQVPQTIKNLRKAGQQKILGATESARRTETILASYRALKNRYEKLRNANLELKSLLGLPAQTDLYLTSKPPEPSKAVQDLLEKDLAALEESALENRPEMGEARLNLGIVKRDKSRVIWQAIPGGELIGTWQRDTNSFLNEHEWFSYSASLTQNILNLIKLPWELRAAKNQTEIERARNEALAAAIVFQVRLAYRQMAFARDMKALSGDEEFFLTAKAQTLKEQYKAGFLSRVEYLEASLQTQLKELEHQEARQALNEAYLQMQTALGQSLPEEVYAISKNKEVSPT